jgi:hypothetical protein
VVNAVLLDPLPFPDSGKLIQVWRSELPALTYGSASYARYLDWRAQQRPFSELGAWAPRVMTPARPEGPERVGGATASASFFRVMGAAPLVGRWFTDDEDRRGGEPVAVISDGSWRRRFQAATSVLGSTMQVDGQSFTVFGVVKEGLAMSAAGIVAGVAMARAAVRGRPQLEARRPGPARRDHRLLVDRILEADSVRVGAPTLVETGMVLPGAGAGRSDASSKTWSGSWPSRWCGAAKPSGSQRQRRTRDAGAGGTRRPSTSAIALPVRPRRWSATRSSSWAGTSVTPTFPRPSDPHEFQPPAARRAAVP